MSWTAPRTWVAGEIVTAAMMNTHVRDDLLALYPHRCEVYRAGTATVATATWTTVSFDQEQHDTDAFHDTGSNTSRITIPSGLGGTYRIYGKTGLDITTTDFSIGVRLQINGSTVASCRGGMIEKVIVMTAGQYVELQEYQGSGGNVTSDGSPDSPTLGVELVELT
jgi:hypothetical protein